MALTGMPLPLSG